MRAKSLQLLRGIHLFRDHPSGNEGDKAEGKMAYWLTRAGLMGGVCLGEHVRLLCGQELISRW